jgi:hypothetical protein
MKGEDRQILGNKDRWWPEGKKKKPKGAELLISFLSSVSDPSGFDSRYALFLLFKCEVFLIGHLKRGPGYTLIAKVRLAFSMLKPLRFTKRLVRQESKNQRSLISGELSWF